jgi:hypothetical protein
MPITAAMLRGVYEGETLVFDTEARAFTTVNPPAATDSSLPYIAVMERDDLGDDFDGSDEDCRVEADRINEDLSGWLASVGIDLNDPPTV